MIFEKAIWLGVKTDIDVLPIIHDVKLAIRESGVTDGLLNIYVPDGRGTVMIAPDGIEKDREFLRWLREWSTEKPKAKEETPKRLYLSHLFGATQTVPLVNGEIRINLNSGIYMVDFTEVETRREFRVALFSEAPKDSDKGQPQIQRR